MSTEDVVFVEDTAVVPLLVGSTAAKSANTDMKHKRRGLPCRLLVCLAAVVAVAVLLCLYALCTLPEFNQYRLVRGYSASVEHSEPDLHVPRTILLWNDFFGDARWSLPADTLGPGYFRDELKCPVYNCELTNEHDFLPAVQLYDAIVFHAAQPFPLLNSVPRQRDERQLYVFALMEPPGETKHILSDEGHFYNLSMTYRLDSDIVWPYNYLLDAQTGARVAPANYPRWRQPPTSWNDTGVWNLWPNKTDAAAWFVSRCDTLSRREQLVAAMQKHTTVDIYGKCGPLSCKRLSKECDDMLDQKYKFYLSFENSLCTDYVTEKLYSALQRQLVPVVFGGADYTRFLPPQSYINAEEYESVEELVSHLQYLSVHPEDYMRYFWWRQYYRLGSFSPFCELCEKLHSASYREKTQTYRDIEKWWIGNSCRFKAKIKY